MHPLVDAAKKPYPAKILCKLNSITLCQLRSFLPLFFLFSSSPCSSSSLILPRRMAQAGGHGQAETPLWERGGWL